jgi:hypothetical protein
MYSQSRREIKSFSSLIDFIKQNINDHFQTGHKDYVGEGFFIW